MEQTLEAPSDRKEVLDLRPGELVRVRTASEIFATLDDRGALEGMPFMPEMLQYCGGIFSVSKRADKTCAGDGVARHMHNAVHLENLRCDGASHGGCQAACLMYWKEAWLERVENGSGPVQRPANADEEAFVAGTLLPATRAENDSTESPPAYRCQATEIPRATGEPVRLREVDQYVGDVRHRSLLKVLRSLAIELFNVWQALSCRRFPEALRIAGGRRYPFVRGRLSKGETPAAKLDLRPGELVRIKSKKEIVATLDDTNHNRGLSFDGEMSNYCGQTARVRARVNRLLNERTGEMIELKSDCIILEGVVCAGDYFRGCTRSIYPYWREIWLERLDESSLPAAMPDLIRSGGPELRAGPGTTTRMCAGSGRECSSDFRPSA